MKILFIPSLHNLSFCFVLDFNSLSTLFSWVGQTNVKLFLTYVLRGRILITTVELLSQNPIWKRIATRHEYVIIQIRFYQCLPLSWFMFAPSLSDQISLDQLLFAVYRDAIRVFEGPGIFILTWFPSSIQ